MSWADETKALTPQIPHRDIWYKSILWFPFFPKYFSTYQPKTHIYKGCSAIPGTGCNNSFQLQAMYPGTKWIRLEGKRARQLQMCSSLVTSKSNTLLSHGQSLPDSAGCTPEVKSSTEAALTEQVGWFLCQQEPADLCTQVQGGLDMAGALFV